jgi:hypothetical protein
MTVVNMDLAYRCQMLPASKLKSVSAANRELLKAGWNPEVLGRDLKGALAWAESLILTHKQEEACRQRAAEKARLKDDDALDLMFAAMGHDPAEIPRKEFDQPIDWHRRRPDARLMLNMEAVMALGLVTSSGSGDIKPFVKYDAKAGRLFRVDRVQQSDGSFASDTVEITNTAQMVMDLANIRVGWINFTSQGPIRRLAVLGKEPMPPRPDDKGADGKPAFKQGFELDLVLNTGANGGNPSPRVLSSAAGCVIEAMDMLHDAYSSAPESKSGKLPAVKITGASPVKSGQSTNYKPEFVITGWVDRPASLAAVAQTASPKIAPSTGSTAVKAPAPQPDLASEFG